jgi:hypothetical protein
VLNKQFGLFLDVFLVLPIKVLPEIGARRSRDRENQNRYRLKLTPIFSEMI